MRGWEKISLHIINIIHSYLDMIVGHEVRAWINLITLFKSSPYGIIRFCLFFCVPRATSSA